MDFLEQISEENTCINKHEIKKVYEYAHEHSQDLSTQIGITIIPDYEGVSYQGTNKTILKKNDVRPFMLDELNKKEYIKHAEEMAFKDVEDFNGSAKGGTMFINGFPFNGYEKLVTANNISKLVFHLDMVKKISKNREDKIIAAYKHLKKEGVEIVYVSGKLGVPARIRGEDYIA